MYFVSPFTPIFFSPSKDITGTESNCMQLFAPTDEIMLQVVVRSESREIIGKLNDLCKRTSSDIVWSVWSMNDNDKLLYHVISGLADGFYSVEINGIESEPFRITSDERELANTVLIQYSMPDNRQRMDAVFWISDVQCFFDWRVHGGFKDDNWSFGVDSDQFVDGCNNRYDVYSHESTQKEFTLGAGIGCPIWFGEMLNRLLSCTYVYFDGERFVRSESSTPKVEKLVDSRRSYVFSQPLYAIKVYDYIETQNLMKIRRVGYEKFRMVSNRLLTV